LFAPMPVDYVGDVARRRGRPYGKCGRMDRWLRAVLRGSIRTGTLRVTAASGATYTFGDGSGKLVAIHFTSNAWQTAVLLDPELRLGEAYMNGGLIAERGSIVDFLEIITKNFAQNRPSALVRSLRALRSLSRWLFYENTLSRSRRNAAHHYNIDFRIYRLFLDSDLQYSCAYFEHKDMSLEEAQLAKQQHIAAKLLLEPGLTVLDIGCGWGGLDLFLARTFKASVIGINLSDEQVRIARQRAAAERLSCEFRIQDYREISERFDRIVSIGMFEHVGRRHYDAFFRKCHDLLRDDGVMLLHTVGRWNGPFDTNAWVWRYIFPGGYSPALSEIAPAIERSGLIISDVEVLRIHYAETLRAWRSNLLANREEVVRLFEEDASLGTRFGDAERFIRMWEYYLAAFEASFRYYGLVVFQLQLVKNINNVPLTRDYIYADKDKGMAGLDIASAAE
jgi:cyclopropane-fatty-acyl-phospholipid synthase